MLNSDKRHVAGSNWAYASPPPDQPDVEKQWWSAVPAWDGKLGSGGGHQSYTPGVQKLYDGCWSVTALPQSEGGGEGGGSTLATMWRCRDKPRP